MEIYELNLTFLLGIGKDDGWVEKAHKAFDLTGCTLSTRDDYRGATNCFSIKGVAASAGKNAQKSEGYIFKAPNSVELNQWLEAISHASSSDPTYHKKRHAYVSEEEKRKQEEEFAVRLEEQIKQPTSTSGYSSLDLLLSGNKSTMTTANKLNTFHASKQVGGVETSIYTPSEALYVSPLLSQSESLFPQLNPTPLADHQYNSLPNLPTNQFQPNQYNSNPQVYNQFQGSNQYNSNTPQMQSNQFQRSQYQGNNQMGNNQFNNPQVQGNQFQGNNRSNQFQQGNQYQGNNQMGNNQFQGNNQMPNRNRPNQMQNQQQSNNYNSFGSASDLNLMLPNVPNHQINSDQNNQNFSQF